MDLRMRPRSPGKGKIRFRRASALLNFVAQDHPDLNGARKESSQVASDVTAGAWRTHLLARWCKTQLSTQRTIAQSSAESELSAMCKVTREGLAAKHLGDKSGQLYTDSSATRGVAMRQGSESVKHRSFTVTGRVEHHQYSTCVKQCGSVCSSLV